LYTQLQAFLGVRHADALRSQKLFPLQQAVLEIGVPVVALRKLFKGERAAGFGANSPFVIFLYELQMVQTGRSAREGPTIDWLIAYGSQYLSRTIVDTANNVSSAFLREYGGMSVGYVSESQLRQRLLCFARREDDSVELHDLRAQMSQGLALAGDWQEMSRAPYRPGGRQYDFREALARVQNLLDFGFSLEAISVASAALEGLASMLTEALTQGNVTAGKQAARLGYRRCLAIVRAGTQKQSPGYVADALGKFLQLAEALYPHRNKYMHELRSVNYDHRRTIDLEREAYDLLAPLLDTYQQLVWQNHIAAILQRSEHIDAVTFVAAQDKARELLDGIEQPKSN
jgi:hypothetical protein